MARSCAPCRSATAKGDRERRGKLSARVTSAIVAWDQERRQALGPCAGNYLLFVTLGARRRDGTYTRAPAALVALLADVAA